MKLQLKGREFEIAPDDDAVTCVFKALRSLAEGEMVTANELIKALGPCHYGQARLRSMLSLHTELIHRTTVFDERTRRHVMWYRLNGKAAELFVPSKKTTTTQKQRYADWQNRHPSSMRHLKYG